jgi:hypothetical protein
MACISHGTNEEAAICQLHQFLMTVIACAAVHFSVLSVFLFSEHCLEVCVFS